MEQIFLKGGMRQADYDYGDYSFYIPPPQRILDLGAYCGYAAVYFANRFPSATIICVEPPGSNFDSLVVNTVPYPQIKRLPAAVWTERTRVKQFGHVLGDWGNYFIPSNGPARNTIDAYAVPEILKMFHWETVDFIKCIVEGAQVDILTAPNRSWLAAVQCVVTRPPAGAWPRLDDDIRLAQAFPEDDFVLSRHEDMVVFTRRRPAGLTVEGGPQVVHLIPMAPYNRFYRLANVSDDLFSFYKFDSSSFQLAPNPPNTPPATIKFEINFEKHSQFCSHIVSGPAATGTVRFHITIIAAGTKAVVVTSSRTALLNGQLNDWCLDFPPATGLHYVELSTTLDGDVAVPQVWARFIDPQFR
jgi:FkbM family methyltransferase